MKNSFVFIVTKDERRKTKILLFKYQLYTLVKIQFSYFLKKYNLLLSIEATTCLICKHISITLS